MKRVLRSGPPNNSCEGRSGASDGGNEFAGRAENVDLACGDVDVAFRIFGDAFAAYVYK